MSETYIQEAKVIIDPIQAESPSIEVSTHRVPMHLFELLEVIHPTGQYQKFHSCFFFHVFYQNIEFTWFCIEKFDLDTEMV